MAMDVHWRNTQRPARFFMLDARASVALLVFMVHIRLWTLVLAILVMTAFWFCERMGLTFASALRAFRCYILGQNRPANRRSGRRRWIEYE
jgi:intracellular multiplication protein IcmT